jgi:hypothetical protein
MGYGDFIETTNLVMVLLMALSMKINPFDVSPSGDLFFADKRNIKRIDKARKSPTKQLSEEERNKLFSL